MSFDVGSFSGALCGAVVALIVFWLGERSQKERRRDADRRTLCIYFAFIQEICEEVDKAIIKIQKYQNGKRDTIQCHQLEYIPKYLLNRLRSVEVVSVSHVFNEFGLSVNDSTDFIKCIDFLYDIFIYINNDATAKERLIYEKLNEYQLHLVKIRDFLYDSSCTISSSHLTGLRSRFYTGNNSQVFSDMKNSFLQPFCKLPGANINDEMKKIAQDAIAISDEIVTLHLEQIKEYDEHLKQIDIAYDNLVRVKEHVGMAIKNSERRFF